MRSIAKFNVFGTALMWCSVFLFSCEAEEPTKEDTPETITRMTLTFSPSGGGAPAIATASDPGGEGVQGIKVNGPIDLAANTSYTLSIELVNELADPGQPAYDVTNEIREGGDEHMFFFSWTNGLFSDPIGNGNIDNRLDLVNYEDEDENGQPIGLVTSWTTGDPGTGSFRVLLKHQPEIKSITSSSTEGETDLDLAFDVNVE